MWSLCVALIATGCSKAVEIPRSEIANEEYREPGSYRIRMKGWEEYLVTRFSVTDSTVVIEELSPSDERFRFQRESLPMTLPLSEVSSISRKETREKTMFLIVTLSAVAVATFISWLGDGGWGQ